MEFGSFVNLVVSGSGQKEPEVGMPATVCHWSDRSPATVVEVLRFKTGPKAGQVKGVMVTGDKYRVVKGSEHDGSAQYEYEPQPDSPHRVAFLINKRGQYRSKSGTGLSLGHREAYRDPSF